MIADADSVLRRARLYAVGTAEQVQEFIRSQDAAMQERVDAVEGEISEAFGG